MLVCLKVFITSKNSVIYSYSYFIIFYIYKIAEVAHGMVFTNNCFFISRCFIIFVI